ncbi:hypothetical protein [Streptomyces sp. NPDC056512]|uniref:hypothetical protein n=1 Tax=Streptomyces sp. NPDC056512 TaxID=3345846 RepID=UPI0036A317D7
MNRQTRVDHARVAAALRDEPGEWLPVGEYRNSSSATSTASMIRTANQRSGSHYEPAGSCEARLIVTAEGTRVEARYRGTDNPAPARTHVSRSDGRRTRQSVDTTRVLGQIERGEVRAGPDAAREIAAKQEAAYGAAWPADHAWAEAVAGLNGGA